MKIKPVILLIVTIFLCSCDNEENVAPTMEILSSTVNGRTLEDGMTDVEVSAEISIVFSSPIDPARLNNALTLQESSGTVPDFTIRYENAQSKLVLSTTLDYATSYEFSIDNISLGTQNEVLDAPFSVQFTTLEDGTVHSLPPCTGTGDCLFTKTISVGSQAASFAYYGSHPLYLEDAHWDKLKYAIIVIHGQNRDADNYFSVLTSSLAAVGMQDSTILISPEFRASADGPDDVYWPSVQGWREGQLSGSSAKISSFALIDSLITRLNDQSKFPEMKKIIVTGHSSGGLFTHLYAASNEVENKFELTDFEYITANSQYFYYPSGQRFNEQTQEFYEPDHCIGYDFWPFGFNNVPAYLNGISEAEYNARFVSRNITYLLGNGTGSDGTLNTTDCDAVLLGSTRFNRGENIHRFMDTYYQGENAHGKTIVEGIGHDGNRMYQSAEFKELISNILKH